MRVITELKKQIRRYGLTVFGRYYSIYRGKVYDNNDPDKLGRIRATCPAVWGNESSTIWIPARGVFAGDGAGDFYLPGVGDPVYLTFEEGDPSYPIWEPGWWLQNATPPEAKEGYPNTRVLKDRSGNLVVMNADEKSITIKSPQGLTVELKDNKINIGNGSDTVGSLLDEILGGLQQAKTATMMGAQPLINVATFAAIKTKAKKLLS